MIHLTDPRQSPLFDPFELILRPEVYQRLQLGWQGLFRNVILELLPAPEIADHFHPTLGAPTKELYSMAGLILIKEFRDWTNAEAAEEYCLNAGLQYALNRPPALQGLCERTIERYEKIFVEDEYAADIMNDLTIKLAEMLEQDVSKQRLDSTHTFSDMAIFGRTRLMGVTIKRFLTQVKRHHKSDYEALPEALRKRYEPSPGHLFADVAKDTESRRLLRQQVAEDMYELIERFANQEAVTARATYKDLVKVFGQQCEIVDAKAQARAKAAATSIQNPTDPDATLDGHKGPGYQVQLCQTSSEANEVQIVTCAIPETAADSDQDAGDEVAPALDKTPTLKPDQVWADGGYGGDESVQKFAEHGIDLQSPVCGRDDREEDGRLSTADFVETSDGAVTCPAGVAAEQVARDDDGHAVRIVMPEGACRSCAQAMACPIRCVRGQHVIERTAKQCRLDQRRRYQRTEEFREGYKGRSGVESLNSGLKRRTGLDRIRARGRPRVFHKILMKVAGWNILQAARAKKVRTKLAEMAGIEVPEDASSVILTPQMPFQAVRSVFRPVAHVQPPSSGSLALIRHASAA